jgi:eukaryotic-like serine/threonine-protein kinase
MRGEAHLAAHDGPSAAIDFETVLSHPEIVGSDPIGAIAHLELGRAFALSGDRIRAKAAFQDFLLLWKDADRDIPNLKRAKDEYNSLN